ncbi:hypothetical protein DAT35_25190 [Vitiosangium sp. GDMCC 1.1324]|nr:hypothetical protein DAT35_25190 [Vitiosangium sp. GDMCC 1.1324]
MVVGALASASLLFPGCTNTQRGAEDEAQGQMGTGGSGSAGTEEPSGTGGSGGAHKGTRGTKGGGATAHDAGTPGPADAGVPSQ